MNQQASAGEEYRPGEEALLAEYGRTRDIALRNRIHDHFNYLAVMVARRYAGRGVEFDDLCQVASLSLIKAIERFDAGRGVRFQSFAIPTIMGEIKNYFRGHSHAVRLPRRSRESLAQLHSVLNELSIELGRTPRTEELARRMGATTEFVLELIEADHNTRTASLDSLPADGEEGCASYRLGFNDRGFAQVENQQFLRGILRAMQPQERYVIIQRFYRGKSQREVAERLGVSQMSVSRIEKKALLMMRRQLDID